MTNIERRNSCLCAFVARDPSIPMYIGAQGMLIGNKHVLKNKANPAMAHIDVKIYLTSIYEI
jgi:hypothetical protein